MKNLAILAAVLLFVNVTFGLYNSPRNHNFVKNGSSISLEPESKEVKEKLPKFEDVPIYRKSEEGTVYGDILSHSKQEPFGDAHGRTTNAHETAHGIHSEIRNAIKSKNRVNAFYCLDGKAAIIDEPNITIKQITEFVPENLRSYRYNLYLVQQLKDWNEIPLYIFDEWNAYVMGGMCGVDDVKRGAYKGDRTDGVSGCLDFSIYAIALAMTVQKYDPEYWKENEQFKSFLKFNLKRANETYLAGYKMKEFQTEIQEKLLKELLESDKAEKMREFINKELDGVWLDQKTVNSVQEPRKRFHLFLRSR